MKDPIDRTNEPDAEGDLPIADWRDRILETGLEEALGGLRPPDLSHAIERALAAPAEETTVASSPRRTPAEERGPSPRPWRTCFGAKLAGFGAGLAAAALLLLALRELVASPPLPDAVRMRVHTGAVALRARGAGGFGPGVSAQDSLSLLASVGDRIRSLGDRESLLLVEDLGVLHMSERSEIEVRAMDWKDFGKGALLGSVTVGVVAGAIHWYSGDASVSAGAGDTKVLRRDDSAHAAMADVLAELSAAKDRIRVLESSAGVASASGPRVEEGPGGAPTVVAPDPATVAAAAEESKPAFVVAGLEDALARIDWKVMGETSSALAAALGELADLLAKGEKPSLELMGRIQQLNGKLVLEAGHMVEGGIPGEGPNGSFTHPAVVANQIAAVLRHAKIPLTEEQARQLGDLASRLSGEDALRRAGYGESTPKLQQILDEMALKERFYRDAHGLLDPDQLSNIRVPGAEGRSSLDIFGTGVAWSQFAKPVSGATREEAASAYSGMVSKGLSLSAEQSARLEPIVSKWLGRFSDSVWNAAPSALDGARAYEVARVREGARIQLEIVRELLASGVLTPQQRADLLAERMVLVPFQK